MQGEPNFYQVVEQICLEDPRYRPDAYEFLMQALYFTQKRSKRKGHVSGQELLEGVRDLGIEKFGSMVKTVFGHWGIAKTSDFGNIVFNLINKKVLSKTEEDSLGDFHDLYDFDSAFGNVLRDSIIKQIG